MDSQSRTQYNYLRLFYFILFGGVGCFWPYITLYFKRIGFNGAEIGVLTAIGPLVLLFTQPVWGILSDKTKSIHRLLSIASLLAMLIVLLFLFPTRFWIFVILMGLFNLFAFAMIPLSDTLSLEFVKRHGLTFGSIRAWGSFGYCIIVVIVGQLAVLPFFGQIYSSLHPELSPAIIHELRGLPVMFCAYALVALILFFVSFKLPRLTSATRVGFGGGAFKLLKNPRFAFFLFAIFLIQATTTGNTTYFSLYIDHLHGQTGLLGLAMTLAALSEIPIFLFATKIFRRFNSLHLLSAAGLVGLVRWYLFTLIQNPVTALWLQPAHAINFGCYYLGAVHFVDEESPAEWKTTGQTLFWAVGYGMAAIAGNYFGGIIYNQFGVITLYRLGALIAGFSALLFYLTDKLFPRKLQHP